MAIGPARIVFFSKMRGIYLGHEKWSKETPNFSKDCPSFNQDQAKRLLPKLKKDAPDVDTFQVFPDRPGHRASQDAVATAGLPRWRDKETNENVSAPVAVNVPGKMGGKPPVPKSTPQSRKATKKNEDKKDEPKREEPKKEKKK